MAELFGGRSVINEAYRVLFDIVYFLFVCFHMDPNDLEGYYAKSMS